MEGAVNKLKSFAKWTQDFASGILARVQVSNRSNPIEILKRLQRESFSDIMKLRDRQEKVERVLAFFKSSKGSPFQEASTHVRGEFDAVGALLMIGTIDESKRNAIERSIRTGIDSRLTFETTLRETDTLVAEFVGSERGQMDIPGSPLSLAKVLYAANISDSFSAVAIPFGGRCRDVAVPTNSREERGLTDYSSFGPPLLNQLNGSGIAVMVKKSIVVASLAQFVSAFPHSDRLSYCFGTFGQVVCQLSSNTKLSIMGVHKMANLSSQQPRLAAMSLPIGILQRSGHSQAPVEENSLLDGSIAAMLESKLDESTRIGGWVEMKRSNPKHLQWGVTMSDTPEDDFGWGLSLGGLLQGPRNWDHFQVESFLNFNLGNKCKLQPGLLYVMDGATQFPALTFRTSWSL
ncbi:putative acyl carrier protein 2, mitochondrial-like [Capsicum annuum]|nr:putative acyl carrier protein 2, mitochondrial-like [Capsicum annuum]